MNGPTLKALRNAVGATLAEVATRIGIRKSYLSEIEHRDEGVAVPPHILGPAVKALLALAAEKDIARREAVKRLRKVLT